MTQEFAKMAKCGLILMGLLAFFISRSEGQIQEEGKQKLRIASVLNPPFLQLKRIASENETNDGFEGFTKDLLDTLGYDYEIVIPGVNFINILRAAFALIFFCQKVTKPNCN